jgi:hypothetical protein
MSRSSAEKYSGFVSYAQSIQLHQHILSGGRGSEENVKIKIVVPLLQAIGWDVLRDMDFERAGADIVLLEKTRPAIVVEVKSWGENTMSHLDQCLEYSLKLDTPWVVVTSGKDTALYCSLLNPQDLYATEPLLRFSFDELTADVGTETLKEFDSLLGRSSFLSGHHELSRMVAKSLGGSSLEEALREFKSEASGFEAEVKTQQMTEEGFFAEASRHDEGIEEALIRAYYGMLELAKSDRRIEVTHGTTSIGLEFFLDRSPRSKFVGLGGAYPSSAHVSFGLRNWKELGVSGPTYEKIAGFPRKVEPGEWVDRLLELLEAAITEIKWM